MRDWKPYPLVHAPWHCPHDPPEAMLTRDERCNDAYEAAAKFCIIEHGCKVDNCARTRLCMQPYYSSREG